MYSSNSRRKASATIRITPSKYSAPVLGVMRELLNLYVAAIYWSAT